MMGESPHRIGIEPRSGWFPRPWDHRLLADSSGTRRVATDNEGKPLTDRDGNYVMTGPGFDFQAVVAEPLTHPFERDLLPLPAKIARGLNQQVARARRYAQAFGHTWVGLEHVALTVQDRAADGTHDADHAALLAAIARSYDGPDWERRVAVVKDRLANYWSPPRPNDFVEPPISLSLAGLLNSAALPHRASEADHIVARFSGECWAFATLLLARAGEN